MVSVGEREGGGGHPTAVAAVAGSITIPPPPENAFFKYKAVLIRVTVNGTPSI